MKITNKMNLPQPFVDAVTREYTYQPKRFSVTRILGGIKEAILLKRHDSEIEMDTSDCVWMIFGTAVHSILENSKETENQIKENKLEYVTNNGYTLSGIFDLYDYDTQTVTDYKTGSVWKVKFDNWDDYRKQCLIYCFMLNQIGLPANKGENVMMLKDWSVGDYLKAPNDYPKHPVYVKHYDFSKEELFNIGEYIEERFSDIEFCEGLNDDDIPPCTPEERWAKPTTYAVFKGKNVRATKVFSSEQEAIKMVNQVNAQVTKEADKMRMEIRVGEDSKCKSYCQCAKFCNYWKEHYKQIKEEIKGE